MAQMNYQVMKDKDLLSLLADRKLTYPQGAVRKDIIEMLKKWDIENGEANVAMEQTDEGLVEAPLPEKTDNKKQQPWVQVIFHNLREDDPPYVFVGHNGKAFYLPKEKPLWLPEYIINSCIKDAVELHTNVKLLPNGQKEIVPRKVQRFPYSLLDRKMR